MGELTKKLHYIKTGGSEETIALYDSTTDCPSPYLSFTVDGANAYAKLGDVSDSLASAMRVYRNSDGKTYAVLKSAAPESNTFNVTSGANGSYVGYNNDTNWGHGIFGSTTAHLPNGFVLRSIHWSVSGRLCYVTLYPALSQYISAIVFGDNEAAVSTFSATTRSDGSGQYTATLSDSTATWLANNAGSGKTVQVVIYANEL